MRRCLGLIFICYSNMLLSQNLKISVLGTNYQPIPTASIIIKEVSKPDKIKEFTIAYNGQATISLKENYKSILIEVKANGYHVASQQIEKPTKDRTYPIDLILIEKDITELEEVFIIAKKDPFTLKEDTLTYDVKSYLDGTERKVQDMLKNLPGIEVNKISGEIKYKGKSIETVLLEGDNLFGQNYMLGTKNINIDMVEQVQAIENYSENPLLKGLENDDKVALNLVLKKGKFDFSGNVSFGTGVSASQKQVFNTNSNILGIAKNYKSFGSLTYNNIGINNSPFDYFGFSSNIEEYKEKLFLSQKIIPETSLSNVLNDDRVNVNNQFFGNYNVMFKIGSRLKIKTNLYYLQDRIISKQQYENRYIIEEDSLVTIDNYSIIKNPKQYRGDLEIVFNTSKSSLLEYNLRIRPELIETPNSITTNEKKSYDSFLKSEDLYVKQNLLFTKKLTKKKALQFSVFQSANEISQTYKINPSVIDSINYSQDVQKSTYTKNYFEVKSSLLGSAGNSSYNLGSGLILDKNILGSDLFSQNKSQNLNIRNSQNNLTYSRIKFYQLGGYQLRFGKWKIAPMYLFGYLIQELNDKTEKTVITQNNFIFEPSINLRYKLNSISFVRGKIGYNQTSNAEEYLFQNIVLINNRTMVNNVPNLELPKTLSYHVLYANNDLYNQLQLNLGVSYKKTRGNFFNNSSINQYVTQINYFYLPENKSSLSLNFLIAKYLSFLESTVKLSSNYNIIEYKNVVNTSELRNNKSEFITSEFFFKTGFDVFINFENSITLINSISKSQKSNAFYNQSINSTFKIILRPLKNWRVFLMSDYFLPNINQKSEHYLFLDASIRYNLPNKNIDFSFVAKNLLNENSFEQIQTSDISTSLSSTSILPRYFLLNISYNF